MPVVIDWKKVEKMAICGASGIEIASALGVDKATLYNYCKKEYGISWEEYKQQKKQKGDTSLKMKQFELAMAGDRSMLVWLGKNRLGQSDIQKIDHSSKGDKINVVLNIDKDDLKNSPIE